MKLTLETVSERLKKQFPDFVCQIFGDAPLGRPLFYVPVQPVSAGSFYFSAQEVKEPEGSENICMLGGEWLTQKKWRGSFLSLGQPELLFNAVQQLFDELENWENTLREIREHQGGIHELLEASYPVFHNPLAVIGQDFSLISEVGLQEFREGEALYYPGSERMELINALKQDEQYTRLQDLEGAVFYPGHIVGFNSWNINLIQSDTVRYRLTLMEQTPFVGKSERLLLEHLARHVQAVLHAGTSDRPGGEDLRAVFRRILTDRTADYVEISHRLTMLGWGPADEYLCLVFQTTYLDQKNLTSHAICNYLEEQMPFTASFPHKDDIVSFFDLTKAGLDAEELGNQLKYFIRESFLKAGYSRVMKGHSNLRRQYVQASLALDVGGRRKPYLWIHWFDQIAFAYILEQCSRKLPGYMLCHEKLPHLRELDEQQGTEYYHTLKVYLEENLSATQSARRLFIHRSTFLYRLDRLKEFLESDLTDPEELLYLNFSIRLLEQDEQKETEGEK